MTLIERSDGDIGKSRRIVEIGQADQWGINRCADQRRTDPRTCVAKDSGRGTESEMIGDGWRGRGWSDGFIGHTSTSDWHDGS